jgi:hypothetical protein
MSTPEGRIKNALKRRLEEFGDECWRFMPVQTGFGTPALDFILCFRGWFVTVETKTPTGAMTDLQKETRRLTLAAGGFVFCVYDTDTLDDFINFIKELGFIHGRHDSTHEPLQHSIPIQAQDPRERKKHRRAEQQAEKAADAACGDNGAPRKKSKRQPVKDTGGDDPAGVTATVTHWCKCGHMVQHPKMVRSVPFCHTCGVAMWRFP